MVVRTAVFLVATVIRLLLYLLGAFLLILDLWLIFFETGLDRWVPVGVAVAGVILLLGLVAIGLSGGPASISTLRRKARNAPAGRGAIFNRTRKLV